MAPHQPKAVPLYLALELLWLAPMARSSSGADAVALTWLRFEGMLLACMKAQSTQTQPRLLGSLWAHPKIYMRQNRAATMHLLLTRFVAFYPLWKIRLQMVLTE
jgi:hypothetical protein